MNNQDMTPEDAKASLGIATRLNEQMLMANSQQNPEMNQQGGQPPEQPQQQQGMDPQMIAELVKNAVREEMGGLRKEIEQIIKDDQQGHTQEDTK